MVEFCYLQIHKRCGALQNFESMLYLRLEHEQNTFQGEGHEIHVFEIPGLVDAKTLSLLQIRNQCDDFLHCHRGRHGNSHRPFQTDVKGGASWRKIFFMDGAP